MNDIPNIPPGLPETVATRLLTLRAAGVKPLHCPQCWGFDALWFKADELYCTRCRLLLRLNGKRTYNPVEAPPPDDCDEFRAMIERRVMDVPYSTWRISYENDSNQLHAHASYMAGFNYLVLPSLNIEKLNVLVPEGETDCYGEDSTEAPITDRQGSGHTVQ